MGNDFIFGITSFSEEIVKERQRQGRGLWHGHRISPRSPAAGEKVRFRLTVGADVSAANAWCYYTTDGRDPAGREGRAEVGTAIPLRRVGVQWDDFVWGYVEEWEGEIPGQPRGTLVRYLLEAGGMYADGGEGSATDTPYFAYTVEERSTPSWIWDAVMYYVMPDRFFPGSGRAFHQTHDVAERMGGTLRGLREKLPYLEDLGFNCLWLMPFFASPTYHHYDATDFYRVAESLGTNDDLKHLIDEAHQRGMRVMMDFVSNHTSSEHPFFLSAQTDKGSPYYDWFTFRRWPDEYKGFMGVRGMPQLNLEHPPARRYMLDLAVHLIEEYGFDGYDLDYALGPSLNFWAEFGRTVRSVKPDFITLAEGVTTPPQLLAYQGRIDGCLDFAWCQAARQLFATGERSVSGFERFLQRNEAFFPGEFVLPTFVDNHNMNRFLWMAGGDVRRLKVAAACQYSLSQPPSVYAGTEVGLSQERDCSETLHPSRPAMVWDDRQDQGVLDWYRRLGRARRESRALRRGERIPLIADDAAEILAYRKADGDEECLVVLHPGEGERTITLDVEAGTYRDLLSSEEVKAPGGSLQLKLGPWSAKYLVM